MLCLLRQYDDLVLRKVNSTDASVFAQRYSGSSQCWGVIWSFIALAFMVASIIAELHYCQTWRDVTPAVPTRWYCQCLSPCCLEESVIGNSLYTLAGSARRWGGGNVARAEPGTQLEDTPGRWMVVDYKYQLATQVDREQVHLSQKS